MNETRKLIIYSACILIEIVLIIMIFLNGSKLDCSKCQVNFQAERAEQGAIKQDIKMNITELYKSYINNYCVISWEETTGYIYDYRKVE